MTINAFHTALVLLLPLQVGVGPKEEEDYPRVNPKPVMAYPYHFTYDSWVRANPGGAGFTFGRCVATQNSLALFVDWKQAGVKGFAQKGWACLYELPADKPDAVTVDPAALWYGAQPDKINAPFQAVAKTQNKSLPVAPADLPEKPPPLKSRVKTSIPRRAAKTPELAEGLTRVDLNFISTVEWRGNKYEYTFVCEPRIPLEAAQPIRFRWMRGALNLAQKLGQEEALFALPRNPNEPKAWRFQLETSPAYQTVHIEFLDEQGKEVVASAPVAVYLPAEGAR